MNDSKIRLVVSDMDGTLLDGKGNLPASFDALYSRMRKHGIVFAAASGRQMFSIINKFPDLGDDMYFIAENGAYATYRDETLIELAIKSEDIKRFREIAKDIPDTYIVLSGKKHAYVESHDQIFLDRLRSYAGRLRETDDVSTVEDDTFFKFTLCDFRDPLKNSLKHFNMLRDKFTVQTSGTKWLDITNKAAGKAEAVKLIQKRLGITPEETVVFGDYLNDLQMIKDNPNSYGMSNGIMEVREAAKNSAPSNEAGGVAIILDAILPD